MRKLFRDFGNFQPKQLLCSQFVDDDEDSGDGGSEIITHLIDQVGTLTNTALLRNSNPVNTAILTNTPISTPYATTSTQASSSLMTFGILALAAVAVFAGIHFAEK